MSRTIGKNGFIVWWITGCAATFINAQENRQSNSEKREEAPVAIDQETLQQRRATAHGILKAVAGVWDCVRELLNVEGNVTANMKGIEAMEYDDSMNLRAITSESPDRPGKSKSWKQ